MNKLVSCLCYILRRNLNRISWFFVYWVSWPKVQIHRIAGTKYVRSRYGPLLKANWKDSTFRACYHAGYLFHLSDFLLKIKFPFVFLDIGANQGIFSLVAGNNFHCLKVLAFEPVPETYSLLEKNIRINKLENVIVPYEIAISNQCGLSSIRFRETHSGGATIDARKMFGKIANIDTDSMQKIRDSMRKVRTIDHRKLEELMPEKGSIIVKIDVEGHDDVVINELTKLREFYRIKAIFYEVDERWISPEKIRHSLEAKGFHEFTKFGRGRHYDILALSNHG